jgi:hypothetical protein
MLSNDRDGESFGPLSLNFSCRTCVCRIGSCGEAYGLSGRPRIYLCATRCNHSGRKDRNLGPAEATKNDAVFVTLPGRGHPLGAMRTLRTAPARSRTKLAEGYFSALYTSAAHRSSQCHSKILTLMQPTSLSNEPPALADYDTYEPDPVLRFVVKIFDADWASQRLQAARSAPISSKNLPARKSSVIGSTGSIFTPRGRRS